MHYQRSRGGIPLDQPLPTASGDGERFVRGLITNEDGDECVFWPFGSTATGYALATVQGYDTRYVHVIVYLMRNGIETVPDGKEVCHICGNGHLGCVNPSHLILGTHRENMGHAAYIHESMSRGSKHPGAKLTEQDVLKIVQDKRLNRVIAEDYGVERSAIYAIKTGRSWSWLTGINRKLVSSA